MHNQIENPMGEYGAADNCGSSPFLYGRNSPIDNGRANRSKDRTGQAVRERHVIAIERICRGDPGNDPDLLNPQQNQDCPDDVDELYGDEQDPRGNDWLPGLASEAGSVVTDKHRICVCAGSSVLERNLGT
jgi:hypothetical protein